MFAPMPRAQIIPIIFVFSLLYTIITQSQIKHVKTPALSLYHPQSRQLSLAFGGPLHIGGCDGCGDDGGCWRPSPGGPGR